MKKLFFIAAAFVLSAGVIAQDQKPDDVAKFNTEKYDFGKVKQNVPAVYYFEITNKSDKPLVIENAHATCGCTTPEYQKDPILPGKTAKLKVQYNAAGIGHFDKGVFVKFAGITEEKSLGISGEVLEPTAYDTYAKDAEAAAAAKAAAEKEASTKEKGKNKSKNKSSGK